MHEKYGITKEQLIAEGQIIVERNSFRNFPFWHYITVACSAFQWDAVIAYRKHQHKFEALTDAGQGYHQSAAFHLWYQHNRSLYSTVGLHYDSMGTYSPGRLREFLNCVTHELQHALVANEVMLNINSTEEEEPRAYATGNILSEVLLIASREWDVGIIAVPKTHYAAIAAVDNLPASWVENVNTLTALSGIIHARMTNISGVVQHEDGGWASTTYFSGGEHV